jgi:hypothetical protein
MILYQDRVHSILSTTLTRFWEEGIDVGSGDGSDVGGDVALLGVFEGAADDVGDAVGLDVDECVGDGDGFSDDATEAVGLFDGAADVEGEADGHK